MRVRSVLAFSALAVFLAGCSAAGTLHEPATPTPAESLGATTTSATLAGEAAAPSASQSSPAVASPSSGQAWADSKIEMWKENSGIKSTKGFLYPYNLMTSWESPEPGAIIIYLDSSMEFGVQSPEPYQTREDELRFMGRIMFESVGEASPELESVTFSTEDGKNSGTYSRARTGADPKDREAWADEKYTQWITAMNDTYESFCGTEITKLEIYRSCIPNDPHAYISKVHSPVFGELVVTIDDGPWMDGTYDMPASSFVSSNMMIKINSKAATGEKVEKLKVVARDGEDVDVALRKDWEM